MTNLLKDYSQDELRKLALDIIDTEDFTVRQQQNGKWKLLDRQIESSIDEEEFDNLEQMIDRLEIFHEDYYIKDLRNLGLLDFEYQTWQDIVNHYADKLDTIKDYKNEIIELALICNSQLLRNITPNGTIIKNYEDRKEYFYKRLYEDCGVYLMRVISKLAETTDAEYTDICAEIGMTNSETLDFLDAYNNENGWVEEN